MNNFETKVDELGVVELKAGPIDLKKFSDVVIKEVVKTTVYNKLNTKINDLEKEIPYAATLIHINKIYVKKLKLLIKKCQILLV